MSNEVQNPFRVFTEGGDLSFESVNEDFDFLRGRGISEIDDAKSGPLEARAEHDHRSRSSAKPVDQDHGVAIERS